MPTKYHIKTNQFTDHVRHFNNFDFNNFNFNNILPNHIKIKLCNKVIIIISKTQNMYTIKYNRNLLTVFLIHFFEIILTNLTTSKIKFYYTSN